MSNPNQLFLLADHIKLSLLERQRAASLALDSDGNNPHDAPISRSLDQFREGVAALEEDADKQDKRYVAFTLRWLFSLRSASHPQSRAKRDQPAQRKEEM